MRDGIYMSLVLVLGPATVALGWIAAFALCAASAHADEREARTIEAMLDWLNGVRSPSGRRFFPHRSARRELIQAVRTGAGERSTESREPVLGAPQRQ